MLRISIILLIAMLCSCILYGQDYIKSYLSQEQEFEYLNLSNVSQDSLLIGLDKNSKLYINDGGLANLFLCNNYIGYIRQYRLPLDTIYFFELRNKATELGHESTEEYAYSYIEQAMFDIYSESSQEYLMNAYNILGKIELENPESFSALLYNMVFVYKISGDYINAFKYAEECFDFSEQNNIGLHQAKIYMELGASMVNDNPELGELLLEKCLQVCDKYNITDEHKLFLRVYKYLSANSSMLHRYEDAIFYVDSALYYGNQLNTEVPIEIARLLSIKCEALTFLKDTISAKACINEIDNLCEQNKSNPNLLDLIECYQATANQWIKDYDTAIDIFEKNIKTICGNVEDTSVIRVVSRKYELLRYYTTAERYDEFSIMYENIIGTLTKGKKIDSILPHLTSVEYIYLISTYSLGIDYLCLNADRYANVDSILNLFKLCLRSLNYVGNRFSYSSSTVMILERVIYDNIISIYGYLDPNELTREQLYQLWLTSSTLKSFDLVLKTHLKTSESSPDELYRNMKTQLKLTDKEDPLYESMRDDYLSYCLKEQLLAKEPVKESIEEDILKENEEKAKVLLDSIANNQMILDFYTTDSVIGFYALSKGNIKFTSTKLVPEIQNSFKKLTQDIKTNNFENNLAFQLIAKLIGEVIDEDTSVQAIQIIGNSILFNFPFEILPYRGRYLVETLSVSYSYSPFIVMKENTHQEKWSKAFFGIAPGFSKSSESLFADISSLDELRGNEDMFVNNKNLKSLPNTIKEINEIEKLFKERDYKVITVKNQDATKENFKKMCRDSKIIHIATHGFSSKNDPSYSRLVYSEAGAESNLYADEIYSLDLNADLVVLSACKTGTGKIIDGEGVMALPRGFIYAGVPNVIASLWKVHDEKTKDLMVAFYTHLLEDKVSYAEALRLAKLDCIEKGFLPIDWAGFVLIGN